MEQKETFLFSFLATKVWRNRYNYGKLEIPRYALRREERTSSLLKQSTLARSVLCDIMRLHARRKMCVVYFKGCVWKWVAGISGQRYWCGIAGSVLLAIVAFSSVAIPGTFWSWDWAVFCTSLVYWLTSFCPLPPLRLSSVNSVRCLEDCMGAHGWVMGLPAMGGSYDLR